MPLPRSLTLLALAPLAGLLPGQETTAPATTPPNILVEALGPDAWRVRFAPTNLGSLLESERGHALWQPRVMPLLDAWQEVVGDEQAFAAQRARVLGYAGRVRIAIWLTPAEPDPEVQIAVVCDGDGHTDLAVLAADLGALLTRTTPGSWNERDLGGRLLPVREVHDLAMTQPKVDDGRIVFAAAPPAKLAATITAAYALPANQPTAQEIRTMAPLHVHFDLPTLVAIATADESTSEQGLLEALGCDSLGALDLNLATAGPRISLSSALHFLKSERGIFSAFCPPTAKLPTQLPALPAATGTWRIGHFDFSALYTAVERAIAIFDKSEPAKIRAEVVQELGVDPVTDLMAHATDEVLFSMSPIEGDDTEEALRGLSWSLVLGLRDEHAFDKAFATLMTHAKPFLTRAATEKHGEIDVHRFGNMFGYDLWYAVGNGALVLGGGPAAFERLGGQLDALAAQHQAPPKVADMPLPKAMAGLEKFVPAGCNGCASTEIDTLAIGSEGLLLMFLGMYSGMLGNGEAGADDAESRDALRKLLRESNLGTVRTATGYADETWRWHLFW